MSILLLYSDYSRGVSDYTEALYDNVMSIDDHIVCLPEFNLMTQQQTRDYISMLLESYNYNIVHIQYDTNIVTSGDCEYEGLENLIWLLQEIHNRDKLAVITYHGMIDYDNSSKLGLVDRYRLKLLRKLFRATLIPLLNKSRVIVHSYEHYHQMTTRGVTNVYMIPDAICRHETQVNPRVDSDQIKLVIPGQRSTYKQYILGLEILRNLPEEYIMYISDSPRGGIWSDDSIFRGIRDKGLRDRVILTQFSDIKSDYLDQLAMFDAAILPYEESAPSCGSLNDCLSVGLPCFTSATTEFKNFNQSYNCTVLTDCTQDLDLKILDIFRNRQKMDMLRSKLDDIFDVLSVSNIRNMYTKVYGTSINIDIDTDRKNALFIGSDHQPNIDAVLDIVTIARHRPEYDFNIVGSVCDYFYYRYDDILPQNLKLHGIVNDLRKGELLVLNDVALNPVETGSGSNLKMLDYLASGIPTITTPVGARGLDIPADMLIICDKDSIYDHLDEVPPRPPSETREYVQSHYDWAAIAKKYYQETLSQYKNKIVVVNTYGIYPPRGGGQNRIFYLYKEIAKRVPVTIISIVPPHGSPGVKTIADNLTQISVCKSADHMAIETQLEEEYQANLGDVSVMLHHDKTPEFGDTIIQEAADADVIISSHPYCISAICNHVDIPIIYESHNVEYILKKQILPENIKCNDIIQQVFDHEKLACDSAQHITTCSKEDSELLRSIYKTSTSMSIVPNGTDTQSIPLRQPGDQKDVINVFMCCRDNEKELPSTFGKLKQMERSMSQYQFRYYIVENDSEDTTPMQIQDFFSYSHGQYSTDVSNSTKWGTEAESARVRDMAYYRNKMKNLCTDWERSEYSFVIDTGIQFSTTIMRQHIKSMEGNPGVVMSTPYGTCSRTGRYYDLYALKMLNGPGGRELLKRGSTIDIPTDSSTVVDSAFGGFVCIRTYALEKCNWSVWSGNYSEHVPFCLQVKRFGDIIINPDIQVTWSP